MSPIGAIDLDRVWALGRAEQERFTDSRPRSMALRERARASMPGGVPMAWFLGNYPHLPVWVSRAAGAGFEDVDGHRYVDFLVGLCAAFCGHAPQPVTEAVARQVALGTITHLPTEDAIWVAEELSRRFVPMRWQFSLTSSQSNQDCIRVARAVTGRNKVVKFDASYHGHIDSTLVILDGTDVVAEYQGVDPNVCSTTAVTQFNDVDALERVLAPRDVALVIAEPAMSNVEFIEPDPGFHAALRRLTSEAGTLLLIDETQTLVCAHGGLTSEYRLEPDMFVVGKSIGGGVPFSAYGLSEPLAALLEAPAATYEVSGEAVDEIATGGTTWANALSVAAARAALEHILTPQAYDRTRALGSQLADGMEAVLGEAGLPWVVEPLFTRAAYTMSPNRPRNAVEARAADIPGFKDVQRIFMANRGIWDFGWWGGPSLSVAHTQDDVQQYLTVFKEFITAVAGTRSTRASAPRMPV